MVPTGAKHLVGVTENSAVEMLMEFEVVLLFSPGTSDQPDNDPSLPILAPIYQG